MNREPREVISIEGTLLMLDDRTPHVAVPVQAVREGKVIATTLSDDSGRYRLVNLGVGSYQVRLTFREKTLKIIYLTAWQERGRLCCDVAELCRLSSQSHLRFYVDL